MTQIPGTAQENPTRKTAAGGRELVRINGRVVPRSLSDDDHSAWQKMLEQDYLNKRKPVCLCLGGANPLEMYIQKHGRTYILKRMPNSGQLHHPECESHGKLSQASRDLYTKDAISETRDGKVSIKLSVPLSTIAAYNPQDEEKAQPPRNGPGVKRNTISLRGLLNLLWEESGLNEWSPCWLGKRSLGLVYSKLTAELDNRVFGRQDADRQIYVPNTRMGPQEEQEKIRDIDQRLNDLQRVCGQKEKPILIVIGEVYAVAKTQYNCALKLKGMPHTIWTPEAAVKRLRDQWPNAVDRFLQSQEERRAQSANQNAQAATNRLFVIAGVQQSPSGSLQWRFGAAMETTEDFIPAESAYEARVARLLVDQGRKFTKPMLYDAQEGIFPDFVLTDAGTPYSMEVFGMSTPEYTRRKQEKLQKYKESGQAWWYWDATVSSSIPALPPRSTSHA